MKHENIVFPSEEYIRDDIWVMYVDGVNSMICELHHPDFSRDTDQYYHNYNGCGLTYNLEMNLFQDRLICMNVPFKSRSNNYKVKFVEHCLRDKLKEIGKKSLGEKIYNGNKNEIITFNAFDCDTVTKFKARA